MKRSFVVALLLGAFLTQGALSQTFEGIGAVPSGGGGSVSITAADGSIIVSPSPITGTGTITVGTVTVAKGGTGVGTFTAHGVLLGEGTGNVVPTAAGASGALLIGQGAADPSFYAMSGDATITNAGVISVAKVGGDANVAFLDVAQAFTKRQTGTPVVVSLSTATFTPAFDSGNVFTFALVHASCPCTIANPSTTPIAGTTGMLAITQSATGSDTIGTWGSQYVTPGGVATITLSTGASVTDFIPFYVADSTHIILGAIIANPTH